MEEGNLTALLNRDDIRLLTRLAADCRVSLYLVGGGVRDLLLGRPGKDLDFALDGECSELPRRFAAAAGGTFFWLDEERRHGRVVLGRCDGRASYDFVPLQGGSIEADLLLRDFTINALALPLTSDIAIIDLSRGMDDLQRGVIRTCSPRAFTDDPVRLVRALRFAATLGFTLAESTWDELSANAHLLGNVAAERVRDELFRILDVPSCLPFIRQLAATGLLSRIVETDCCTGGIETSFGRTEKVELLVAELERRFPVEYDRLAAHLESQAEDGITLRTLLKMSAFIGQVGAETVVALAEKLRLGNRSRRVLRQLCRSEFPVGLLLPSELQTSRAMYRLFRDESPVGLELVLLALTEGVVTDDVARRFVGYYFHEYEAEGEADLYLTGTAIMALLGIDPGPDVGTAAARLREAESRGVVNSREEAEEFLRKNQLTNPAPMG